MTDRASTGWTGGQQAFGDVAPGLVHYADRVLFDEVWEREDLSKRDRGRGLPSHDERRAIKALLRP